MKIGLNIDSGKTVEPLGVIHGGAWSPSRATPEIVGSVLPIEVRVYNVSDGVPESDDSVVGGTLDLYGFSPDGDLVYSAPGLTETDGVFSGVLNFNSIELVQKLGTYRQLATHCVISVVVGDVVKWWGFEWVVLNSPYVSSGTSPLEYPPKVVSGVVAVPDGQNYVDVSLALENDPSSVIVTVECPGDTIVLGTLRGSPTRNGFTVALTAPVGVGYKVHYVVRYDEDR